MSERTFTDKPGVREQVPLLAGIVGPSGGGKTYSALELATGIQQVTGGDIGVVDTEARRALHYADRFKFRHLEFGAPFGSLDYLAAIQHFVSRGVKIVIVDSMSHEHEGPGGMLDSHEKELERIAGSDWAKRERVKMLAWARPKADRRRLINALLQMNANFIFCFRAKEKMKMEKGKEPQPLGWQPIAGEEFVFEMTVNFLLVPGAGGVPLWQPEYAGERAMIKLPEQFKGWFADGKPLTREHGRRMAEWARGNGMVPGVVPTHTPTGVAAVLSDLPESWETWTLEQRGENRAHKGMEALQRWWATLTAAEKAKLKAKLDSDWKPIAEGSKS